MNKLIFATALTLAALPAYAGEGNGNPFALRTPGFSTAVAASQPDTGTEDTSNLSRAFAQTAGQTQFTGNASEASVQVANSLPAGALTPSVGAFDGGRAYAQHTAPGTLAR